MGYALFAARKLVLNSQLNCAQLQQTQRDNEKLALTNKTAGFSQQASSLSASQSGELADLYKQLTSATSTSQRDSINDQIKEKEKEFTKEIDEINQKIYEVSIKESAMDLEIKRLDTLVGVLKQQLQDLEKAEGEGIKNSAPKYTGVGN